MYSVFSLRISPTSFAYRPINQRTSGHVHYNNMKKNGYEKVLQKFRVDVGRSLYSGKFGMQIIHCALLRKIEFYIIILPLMRNYFF